MSTKVILALCGSLMLASLACAQPAPRGGGGEFAVTKINRNLITAPQYTYTGAQQFQANQRDRWLEVEVEFTATPEYTDELTFKYYILVNGKLLTGEVTHVSIAGARDLRSVMYVSPKTLARAMGNRPVGPNSVQNIAVQIVQQGAVKGELSLDRAAPNWFATMPQLAGQVLNKNETPFAPLYWDRYEQIKAPAR
ncbi:MAG TPA: Amuc_1102 family pilus-like protein [Chthoniobacterales bacterium]